MADLDWLRRARLDAAIIARRRAGTPVIGICGGYQMLGRRILDPDGVESDKPETRGLGLLPVTTLFAADKATHQVRAKAAAATGTGLLAGCAGADIVGYEIHMGRTSGAGAAAFRVTERSGIAADSPDGAIDPDGLTLGTYIHGLFHNHALRRAMLTQLAKRKGVSLPDGAIVDLDAEYDKLADLMRRSLDMRMVYEMAGLR